MRPPSRTIARARPDRYLSGWNCACRGNRSVTPGIESIDRRTLEQSRVAESRACARPRARPRAPAGRRPSEGTEIRRAARNRSRSPRARRSLRCAGSPPYAISAAYRAPSSPNSFDDLVVAVVERVREMRGRASGLTAADRAVVDHHDRLAGACEHVRRGQSGDARANDADVRARRIDVEARIAVRRRCPSI